MADASIRCFVRKAACVTDGRGLPSGCLYPRSAENCRREAPGSNSSQRYIRMNVRGKVVSRRPEVLLRHRQRRSRLALRMMGRAAASPWTLSPTKGPALTNAPTKRALSATRTPRFGRTAIAYAARCAGMHPACPPHSQTWHEHGDKAVSRAFDEARPGRESALSTSRATLQGQPHQP